MLLECDCSEVARFRGHGGFEHYPVCLSLPAATNESRSKKANRVPKRAPCNTFTRIQEVVDLAYYNVEHKLKETWKCLMQISEYDMIPTLKSFRWFELYNAYSNIRENVQMYITEAGVRYQ